MRALTNAASRLVALGLIAVLLSSPGCGSDNNRSGGGPTPTASGTPPPTPAPTGTAAHSPTATGTSAPSPTPTGAMAFCSASADALFQACGHHVQGDRWVAEGICINESDDADRRACF